MSSPKPFVQPGDALSDFLRRFWQRQVATAEREKPDWKHPSLPIARIKKVMKSDPDVKVMIASDAPILFCKACEIFIAEITARAFLIADSNKRRTLSRADIAKALSKSDQFDFLIDIVPREDPYAVGAPMGGAAGPSGQQVQQVQQQVVQEHGLGDGSGGVEMPEYQDQYQQDGGYATMTRPDNGLNPEEQTGQEQLGEEDSGVILQRLNSMLSRTPGMER